MASESVSNEFGRLKIWKPADCRIDGEAFPDSGNSISTPELEASGLCGFRVDVIFDRDVSDSDATQGAFDLKVDAWTYSGEQWLADHIIASSNAYPAKDRCFSVAWLEGDVGDGVNMTSFDCKPLVGLSNVMFKVVGTTSADNGPFTVNMHVTGVR